MSRRIKHAYISVATVAIGMWLCIADSVEAVPFYSISSITSSTQATDLSPASRLHDGPILGYDANEPHNQTPGSFATNRWVTDAPGGFPADYIAVAGMPVLTIDLGQNRLLSEISAWGYASTNANGVSEFSLRFATEAEGTGGFGTSIAFNPAYFLTNDDVARQSHSLGQSILARYVEFTAVDNFFVAPGDGSGGETPGGDRVGLGEIAFEVPQTSPTAVPEPLTATLGLIGLGAAGLAAFRRHRREKAEATA